MHNHFEATSGTNPEDVRATGDNAVVMISNDFVTPSPTVGFHRTSQGDSGALDIFNGNQHHNEITMDAGKCILQSFSDKNATPTLSACTTFAEDQVITAEGATNDGFETTIAVTDPTADRTVTIPNADSTTVQPDAGASNNFLTAISSSGVISKAQPSFTNLSGTAANTQIVDFQLTSEGEVDALGLEFEPGDALTNCSTFAATGGGIFYDDSEGKFKKCQDNTLSDLDTTSAGAGITTIEENNTSVVTSALTIDFLGADFDVTDAGSGEGDVAIAAAIARDTETCGGGACAVGTDDTVTLAQGTAPAPTVEGRAEWETDDDHLIVGDGAAQVEFVPAEDVSGDATMDDAGVVTVANDSHDHTTTTISGVDMSDDTNLTVGLGLVESGDAVNIDYAQTLAGNPALNADEAVLTTDGAAGACILTEGSTANTNEQKYCLPDQDNADATDFIVTDDADSVTSVDGTGLAVSGGTLAVALSELSAGGELGGTLDAPTLDDSVTVATWTLDQATLTTWVDVPSVTAFPGTPPTGAVVIVTDDSAIGACDSAAGSARSLCWYNGTAWQSLGDGGGGGGGAFSDAGDPIVQNTTTKDVHMGDGAGTLTGKVEIGGDADQPQLVVEGYSTQTDDILIVQSDDDNERFTVSAAGATTQDGSATIGAPSNPADAGAIRLDNATSVCWEDTEGTDEACIQMDAAEALVLSSGVTGITVPADSISDSELDEAAAFDWTGAHTFASTVGLGGSATATTPADGDDDTSVATTAFVSSVTKSVYIPAGAMEVDGTQCTFSTAGVVNSGPYIRPINCADSASGIVYWELVMPDSWGGSGAITVEAQAYTIDASVTGGADDTIGWDVSCMARGDGETINSTWGTAQNLDVTFATQYVIENVTSASITPDDFELGDTLFCRMVIDATTTDSTTADMRLKGVKVEYATASNTD
jgi:hypothetical protein